MCSMNKHPAMSATATQEATYSSMRLSYAQDVRTYMFMPNVSSKQQGGDSTMESCGFAHPAGLIGSGIIGGGELEELTILIITIILIILIIIILIIIEDE